MSEPINQQSAEVFAHLSNGLIIRQAMPEDAPAVATLVVAAHTSKGSQADSAAEWTRDLMVRPHPTMTAADVLVVEATGSRQIVSTLNLIPQTWSYAGIPFGVGRVELVATHPDYEGRGLVRRQFEVLHRLSAERGHQLQAISGIPSFYRQFGYEYALDLGGGWRAHRIHVATLTISDHEPLRIRLAKESDVEAIARLDRRACSRSLVSCLRDVSTWRYEIGGRSASSMLHSSVVVLEVDGNRDLAGFAVLGSGGFPGGTPGGPIAPVRRFEVDEGVSWQAATRSLLQYLTGTRTTANELPAALREHVEVALFLGANHSSYRTIENEPLRPVSPDAWYIRVPDVVGFLQHVSSALESRLATSPMAGYSGELRLSFYRSGLSLSFQKGRITLRNWPDAEWRRAGAAFAGLTFLQLLFGYRELKELEHAFPDCWAWSDDARLLIESLFPKTPSAAWPIG